MKAQEKEIAENSVSLLKSSAALNQENKLSLPQRIHFLGIGGAGMTPLAGICLREGVQVSGSDKTPNQNQIELKQNGADIWSPHSLDELEKKTLPEVCVYSTAIPADNEEFQYLKENGVEFWHRSDLLQRIANQFEKQIVISGTHGKTTTTAMLVWILEKAGLKSGLKPCWVLGGLLKDLGSFGWSDQREVFVFEGDESDQSFLKSNPYIGLVTSLEPDHLENYNNSFDVQIEKFQEFAKKSKFFISTKECANAQPSMTDSVIIGKDVSLYKEQTALNGIIFGKHNRLNASAALKAYEIFLSDRINDSLAEYSNNISSEILKLRTKALSEPSSKDFVDYAHLSDEEAKLLEQILFQNTGEKVNFANYKRCISCDEIRKIEKKHGLSNEKIAEQEPIGESDYLNLHEIITNPDSISYAGISTKHKLHVFKTSKEINGHIYFIEEAREGRKKLALLSMYKKKNPRLKKSEVTSIRLDTSLDDSEGSLANAQNDNSQGFNIDYTSNNNSQTPKASIQSAIEYLKDFPGIYRRFELIGTTETGITVIDDYAHHPTEVRTAIKAGKDFLQEKGKSGKLIVLFQPHLPTRLRDLWNEFVTCFQEADELLINDLYVARGREIEGINSQNLITEIQKERSVIYCPGKPESLIEQTLKIVRPNDLVLILGAGDITNIRETLLDKLRLKDFISLTSAASVNR